MNKNSNNGLSDIELLSKLIDQIIGGEKHDDCSGCTFCEDEETGQLTFSDDGLTCQVTLEVEMDEDEDWSLDDEEDFNDFCDEYPCDCDYDYLVNTDPGLLISLGNGDNYEIPLSPNTHISIIYDNDGLRVHIDK